MVGKQAHSFPGSASGNEMFPGCWFEFSKSAVSSPTVNWIAVHILTGKFGNTGSSFS